MASQLTSLTLFDFNDRELLYIIDEAAGQDGFAETPEVAKRLGFVDNTGSPTPKGNSSVGIRLSWMKRYGWLEHDPEQDRSKPTRWRVTEVGEAIMRGKLNKTLTGALGKSNIGDQVLVMREITQSGMVRGGRSKGMALSREFRYNAAKMNGKP